MSSAMMNPGLRLQVGQQLNGSVMAIGHKGKGYAKRGINKATKLLAMIPGYMVMLPYMAFLASLILISVLTHLRGN